MTLLQFGLVVIAQVSQVAGQVLLKKGMTRTRGRIVRIALGTLLLALWFLTWLRLLESVDLSVLYPFEGLSLVLLLFASRLFLGERMRTSTWIGVALITSGMVLVGWSSHR